MKISLYDSSGWVGDAYTSEYGGGSKLSYFIDWLWKSFCLNAILGAIEYVIALLCTTEGGVNFGILSPGEFDYNSFLLKAFACGSFVFCSFVITAKNKKFLFAMIGVFVITLAYGLACDYSAVLRVLLFPLTWVVSIIFMGFGALPVFITELIIGSITEKFVIGFSGVFFGMIFGILFQLIFKKQTAWYADWE